MLSLLVAWVIRLIPDAAIVTHVTMQACDGRFNHIYHESLMNLPDIRNYTYLSIGCKGLQLHVPSGESCLFEKSGIQYKKDFFGALRDP